MQHIRFFILTAGFLIGGSIFLASPVYAQLSTGKCCQEGEEPAKDGSKAICCKGSKESGKLNEACCEKAGGQVKNGKCCKCPSGGC